MSVPLPTSIFGNSVSIVSPTSSKKNTTQVVAWSIVAIVSGVAIALVIYALIKMSKSDDGDDNGSSHNMHVIPIHVNPNSGKSVKPNVKPIPIRVNPNPVPVNPVPVKPVPVNPNGGSIPTHLPLQPPRTFGGTLAPLTLNRYEIFSRPCEYTEKDLMPIEDSRYEYDNVIPRVGFNSRPDNQVTSADPYLRMRSGAATAASPGAIAQVSAAAPKSLPALSSKAEVEQKLREGFTGLVVALMDGCGFCIKLKNEVLPYLKEEILLVDPNNIPELLGDVRGFPHTGVVENGKVLGQIPGFAPYEKFVAKIAEIRGK